MSETTVRVVCTDSWYHKIALQTEDPVWAARFTARYGKPTPRYGWQFRADRAPRLVAWADKNRFEVDDRSRWYAACSPQHLGSLLGVRLFQHKPYVRDAA